MWRYRLYVALPLALAVILAGKADRGAPIMEQYGLMAVLLALAAGWLARKYPAPPPDPNIKSFRFYKGNEKW